MLVADADKTMVGRMQWLLTDKHTEDEVVETEDEVVVGSNILFFLSTRKKTVIPKIIRDRFLKHN